MSQRVAIPIQHPHTLQNLFNLAQAFLHCTMIVGAAGLIIMACGIFDLNKSPTELSQISFINCKLVITDEWWYFWQAGMGITLLRNVTDSIIACHVNLNQESSSLLWDPDWSCVSTCISICIGDLLRLHHDGPNTIPRPLNPRFCVQSHCTEKYTVYVYGTAALQIRRIFLLLSGGSFLHSEYVCI